MQTQNGPMTSILPEPLAQNLFYSLYHFIHTQAAGINHNCIIGGNEGRCGPGAIPPVTLSQFRRNIRLNVSLDFLLRHSTLFPHHGIGITARGTRAGRPGRRAGPGGPGAVGK